MKRAYLLILGFVLISAASFAQKSKSAVWSEMNNFRALLTQVYPSASKGDVNLVKKNAQDLFDLAVKLQASKVPTAYNNAESKSNLIQIVAHAKEILTESSVANSSDNKIKEMITFIYIRSYRITGEYSKPDNK